MNNEISVSFERDTSYSSTSGYKRGIRRLHGSISGKIRTFFIVSVATVSTIFLMMFVVGILLADAISERGLFRK